MNANSFLINTNPHHNTINIAQRARVAQQIKQLDYPTTRTSPGADPRGVPGASPPLKLEKNKIFWRKIVIFHTKYPQNLVCPPLQLEILDPPLKHITNSTWFRARLCKLQKRVHSTRSASDKVYQLLAHGRWFSPGTPTSSTTKTGRHDIAEIWLKVALSTKNQINQKIKYSICIQCR